MNYFDFVSETHNNALESNHLASGTSDEDEAAPSAYFSQCADEVSKKMLDSSNNQKADGYTEIPDFALAFMSSAADNLPLKALPGVKPTVTVECKNIRRKNSSAFELKRPAASSRQNIKLCHRQERSSTHESASVPIFSTWEKQASSPPIKRAHSTWQEISSEINRFAEENIKNEGWDLWTHKKKSQEKEVGETDLEYLSTQTLEDIYKSEMVFQDSLVSQQKLQAWDKMMGLKRSHSRTMTKSSVTRKKMLHALRELKLKREREKRNRIESVK
mmetsp:Transcript_16015/g.24218  ORF Transcript_16015/g.24218 Transcript_16015/m.24218 type:complete len:274 (+) Transcript_16015:69-890(+)